MQYLSNPSLQDPNWTTDNIGNQQPHGWNYWVAHPGELLPIPTKTADHTKTVEARCGANPENVHKLVTQLPADEGPGGPRMLIFPGNNKVYKSFGNQGAIATKLSQTVTVPAGSTVRFGVWVDLDTPDIPGAPDGKLENDHALVRLTCNDVVKVYNRAWLQDPGNIDGTKHRAWVLPYIEATTNTGVVNVEILLQKNWPGPTAFFIQDAFLEVVSQPVPVPAPAPTPDPTPAPAPQPGTVAAAQAAMALAQAQISQDKATLAEVAGQINARYNDLSDLIKTVQDALK